MRFSLFLTLSIIITTAPAYAVKLTEPMPEIEQGAAKIYDTTCGINGNEKISLSSKYTLIEDTRDIGKKNDTVYVLHNLKKTKGRDYLNSIMIYNPKLDSYRIVYQARSCKKIGR